MSESIKPRSDLGVRTLSGVVMLTIAAAAVWYGGYAFIAMVILAGIGVFYEFVKLVLGFVASGFGRVSWIMGGSVYVGVACFTLLMMSTSFFGSQPAIILISGVIGTDVGAYFAGRTFGGPKIAPKISPSKTWSGLFGGMIGAGIMMNAANTLGFWWKLRGANEAMQSKLAEGYDWKSLLLVGGLLAIVAQAGDFFESWMKRRAGVKDSGRLIPGHGGIFDRADGLIAVAFCAGLFSLFEGIVVG